MATNIPMIEPQGLKHCAMFSRRVAVSSGPIVSEHFKTYDKALKEATRSLKENKLTKTRLVIRDYLNHILAVLVYDFVGNFVKIDEIDNIGRPEKTTILYNN